MGFVLVERFVHCVLSQPCIGYAGQRGSDLRPYPGQPWPLSFARDQYLGTKLATVPTGQLRDPASQPFDPPFAIDVRPVGTGRPV